MKKWGQLLQGEKQKLNSTSYVTNRYTRTFICSVCAEDNYNESRLMITII